MLTRDERQALGLRKWVDSKCRGTLAWCTGLGKTRAGCKAISLFLEKNPGRTTLVVVPTENLKVQWIQELSKFKLFPHTSVEIINTAITIEQKVDLLVLDECHRYGGEHFIEIFKVKNPTLVLGLSATFNRLDGRHELLKKFCPVVDTVSVQEAIQNKWLSPYREYKVLLTVPDIHVYYEANRQFLEAFSFFNFDFNLAMTCMTNIVYRRALAKKMGVTSGEMDAVTFTWGRTLRERKAFVMEHLKKIEITRKILKARPNAKAITFSSTIKQAEKIGNGFVVHSGKTKKKNRLTVEEFSKLTKGAIHTAKSMDEGFDCQGLNLAVILCNSSSPTQKTQRVKF